jgi:peptidyl-prolyl cis-trans isomerase B (cyclophilin B)
VRSEDSTGPSSQRVTLSRPMLARTAFLAAVALAAATIAACGGGDGDEEPDAVELPEGCEQVEAPPPKSTELRRPPGLQAPPGAPVAVVETSCGTFEITLDTAAAPKTTASFVHLAEQGVYDDTAFHRIVPDFVVQGGDPRGDGTGGPGYFVDELPRPDTEYTRGTAAMAKTAAEPPGRSGSQFFVVVAADAGLPPDYAPLGEVTNGFGVVERISELGDPASGQDGIPLAPVVIERITIQNG